MTSSFEWDPAKEAENLRKHGVSFREAQLAFLDPERVIARDVAHALSAQGIGAKDRRSMKRKGNYTDEPMGQLEVVEDILPSPNRLVLKEDGVKITISLSKHSVDFFKVSKNDPQIAGCLCGTLWGAVGTPSAHWASRHAKCKTLTYTM